MRDLADRLNEQLEGRYAIQRELGRGGMATVFLAEDVRHRRPVALKVLRPELAAVLGRERFLREIELASRLQHPHILPLHDSGVADGLLYYVMPYVEGESLRARLTREGQLPVRDALRLAGEVSGALDYAHRQGVVHRDIKPENILLADGHAMVADFGIARAIAAAGSARLTETGVAVGTPMYMSPEQALASATLDGRSDLYSLGCVLYEMLSGQPPFTGPTNQILAHQHVHVAPRPVSALRPAVPGAVDRAVEAALAKAPADRFRTVSEFAAAIATAEWPPGAGPGLGSDADPAPGAGRESDRRHLEAQVTKPLAVVRRPRRGLVLAAGAVALLGVALAVWWFGPWRERDARPAPASRAWMLVAEFDGPAADSSVVAATRDLVIAGLEQSESVSVVPTDQIRVALQTAGKPVSTRVDAELARELAYRSAVRTVLEGRIGRLGQGFSVVLRVIDVDSARVVVSVSDAARDEETLIPTINRITRRLRTGLGERRTAIQATRELSMVTTPSLEAFKTLMRARVLLFRNDNRAAITVARSALAHDPDLAVAWGVMGYAFSNLGEADSATHAFRQALARPGRLTESGQLFPRAALASLTGDNAAALAMFDRLVLLHPDLSMAHNNRGAHLTYEGRWDEAVESYRTAERVSPFGAVQQVLGNQFFALLTLGRVDEARRIAPRLSGSLGLCAPMQIAAASGQWSAAESLATALRVNPAAYIEDRLDASWVLAAAQASRGRVTAAEQTLLRVQSEAESAGEPLVANRTRWRRLMLALFSRGVATAPGDPGRWDSTTTGLVTRGTWAAAAGDTATSRRLLAAFRTRSAPDVARQGFAPAILQGWIAARTGRWQEVLRNLGPAALQGEPRGYVVFQSAPLGRWLVAEAYEQLGRPDSAAAYFERAIALPPHGGYDFTHVRMASSFGHRRLALLYARMGRPLDARRHWELFSEAFTRPDPELAPLAEEARAALAGAGGTARSARR